MPDRTRNYRDWLATEKGSLAVRELIAWVVLEKAQAIKPEPR